MPAAASSVIRRLVFVHPAFVRPEIELTPWLPIRFLPLPELAKSWRH